MELSTSLGTTFQCLYLGLGVGEVSEPSTPLLHGNTLSGAVVKLLGAVKTSQYALLVGVPIYKQGASEQPIPPRDSI